MASEELITYIRENADKYGIGAVRDVLIAQGYPIEIVDEAMAVAKSPPQQPLPQSSNVQPAQASKAYSSQSPQSQTYPSQNPQPSQPVQTLSQPLQAQQPISKVQLQQPPKSHFLVKLMISLVFVIIVLSIVIVIIGQVFIAPILQNNDNNLNSLLVRSLPLNTNPIPWQALSSFLPETLSGWTGGNIRGDTSIKTPLDSSGDSPVWSTVERSYRSTSGAYVKIVINDLKEYKTDSGFIVLPETGFFKARTLRSYKGRFEITLTSRQASVDDLMQLGQSLNLEGLKALSR